MEQHQIPQQISSYQFRLVGDMTLKQFFQVGGGSLVAIILYSTSLPSYLKWPLILISFLFGVALAFFPVEDRPLSKWIVLFAKSVYAPTLYVWAKNYTRPQYFQPETVESQTLASQPIPQVQADMQMNTTVPVQVEATEPTAVDMQAIQSQTTPVVTELLPDTTIVLPEYQNDPMSNTTENSNLPEPKEISIPEANTVSVNITEKQILPDQSPLVPQTEPQTQNQTLYQVSAIPGNLTNSVPAQFTRNISAPETPNRPNVVVGIVTHDGNKIIENAIIEIRDQEGRPVRALKSNKLGHFMIVTPLVNGEYTIITEKDGFQFEPLALHVHGEIIEPIEIRPTS